MIRVELRKLVSRPRTWVSIGLLCLLPVVVAVFLAVTGIAPRPGQGPTLLAAVLGNGALYPAAALGIVLPFFLPIAVAVQAGEAVAGEASTGTLRYLLVRPVGRTRLLAAKLVSVVAYTLLAVVAVAVVGYVTGISLLGNSGQLTTTTLSGTALTPTDLAWRTGVMVLSIGWSMVGLAAISLFLSTLTDSSLGAALGGLAALVSSTVLVTLDAAGSVRDYLPTRYWLAWVDLFRDPIPWHDLQVGALVQAGYVLVFLGAAWANFTTRDVTS
ncbi:ABC transporter permease [Phycicoccus jejuensis]|uniref:ABC transporter permease n=1 Tax=Phycicoccus jejuensis TaxID=367299 RepID=UPI0004C39F57|nr:ABC transporter permease [Phycicoccus jejuensis]